MAASDASTTPAPIRLQDFVRLPESLPWTFSRSYWSRFGAQAFLRKRVPFQVTNDGTISRKAAELLFFSLAAEELVGRRPGLAIRVLELGAGSGLFARFFLNAFRTLCRTYARDYYERLMYVVTDRSEKMRNDILRFGLLARHAQHFVVAPADADLDDLGLGEDHGPPGRYFAVFANYVLDSLPATALRRRGGQLEEVFASTCLGAPQAPPWAGSAAELDLELFMKALPSLSMEYEYRPIDGSGLPFLATAEACLDREGPFLFHSYGALGCLESCMRRLEKGGLVLLSDYAHLPFDESTQIFPWQQYDGSIAAGLNLSLLRLHFHGRSGWEWCEPEGDDGLLAFRLLGRGIHRVVADRFRSIFGKVAMDEIYASWSEARMHWRDGQRPRALRSFETAYARQRDNWALNHEFADFLLHEFGEASRGLVLALSGLKENPVYPPLWRTVGRCLSRLNRHEEAQAAYRRARQLCGSGTAM
jgi:hypothetical protein